MFIFAAAFGTGEIGMSPLATSIGFSLNAAAGFIGTRLHARSGRGGWWMLGPAMCALSLVLFPAAFAFYAILAFWGLSWWLAVPEIMRSIASHTDAPDGRVGDAQAFMATGRAIGPLIGGFIITRADFTVLGILAFCIIAAAVVAIVAVEVRRIGQARGQITMA
jgi:predicted MFS family arabinose efflux permease